MKSKEKNIYSLNVEDVQTVAREELKRELSLEEIEIIERKIGNYINWYEIIQITMINANIK